MNRMTYFWCGPYNNTGYDRILSKELDILNKTNKHLVRALAVAGVVLFFQHRKISDLKCRVEELEKKINEKPENE